MKQKLPALMLAAALSLGLTACGGEPSSTAGTDKPYVVGICQLTPHPALDEATRGFQDALEEALPGQVQFDVQNAANDPATCSTIANGFVSKDVDLILGNATPALQAAAAATGDIPVLGTAVTEYGVALNLGSFDGTVGGNISGTSDLAPLDEQAAMVKEWFPEAKTVGLLYCSGEPNSQYQVDVVQQQLSGLGYTCTQYPFADSNDMAAVTQTAAANSDVIYIPTDNTVAANTGIVDNICRPAKVPVIAGEEGICSGCGVATLSIDYYDLGVATGKMAARVLELSDRIVEENRLTTLMVTHNMRDTIAHGNRLIMMYSGRVVIDISGEEKKKLTVPQLLELFNQASGSDEADDKLLLS